MDNIFINFCSQEHQVINFILLSSFHHKNIYFFNCCFFLLTFRKKIIKWVKKWKIRILKQFLVHVKRSDLDWIVLGMRWQVEETERIPSHNSYSLTLTEGTCNLHPLPLTSTIPRKSVHVYTARTVIFQDFYCQTMIFKVIITFSSFFCILTDRKFP